jgi:GR25 family glycosyltransferase involved in LPS biosynthesis
MMKSYGVKYELINAVDGQLCKDEAMLQGLLPGEYGCKASHINALQYAKKQNYNSVLILEDDALLRPNFDINFADWIKQVPESWQIMYLSGNYGVCDVDGKGAYLVRPHVARARHTLTTAAWACHNTIYDEVITKLENGTKQVDVELCKLQKKYEAYGFFPSLITQRDGFSDIQDDFVNYTGVIT